MAELSKIRALLADRKRKAGGYGKEYVEVCLDDDALHEYIELQNEKTKLETEYANSPDRRMSSTPPGVEALDAKIGAAKAEVEGASIVLVFQSLGDDDWNALQARHPDREGSEKILGYFTDLLEKCFMHVESEGKELELSLTDVMGKPGEKGSLSFPQADHVRYQVHELNRRRVDIPFALSTSRRNRKNTAKSGQLEPSGSVTDAS